MTQGLSKVIVEMDLAVAVHLLQQHCLIDSHAFVGLVVRCREVMNQIETCVVQHVFRENLCD